MDISYFIEWFFLRVCTIFARCFDILDSVTFMGTSLLRLSITIIIFSVLIPVILTIGQSTAILGQKSERIHDRKERAERRSKKK